MSTEITDLRTVRQQLQQARGKQKLELLTESDHPQHLIRALPAEELYLALLDIGVDDTADIIAMSSPEQLRHFIDMAAWPRSDEGPRTGEVMRWLRLAREGGTRRFSGSERFRKHLAGLDRELLSLVLRRQMIVHELSEDNQPDPENAEHAYYTPDRRFLLEFSGTAGFAAMRQLIEDLYAQDAFEAGQLIESIRWEVPTELEEMARRWREGRLRDVGVPGFEEAQSFYARPAARKEALPLAAPGSTALVAPSKALLDEALALLSADDLETAEEAITYAANAALVANRVPLDDAEEVRDQLSQARATLSLGLELLSGGDPAQAAEVLARKPVREIFQTAMGEAYRLQTRARKLAAAARLPQAQSATLLETPLGALVEALQRPRPLFAEPGVRKARGLGSRADVARAEDLLEEGEGEVELLNTLGLSPAALGPLAEAAGLGPSALLGSDAIRALAEAQLSGTPLKLDLDRDRPLPEGFAAKLDELLSGASSPASQRASSRIRTVLTRK